MDKFLLRTSMMLQLSFLLAGCGSGGGDPSQSTPSGSLAILAWDPSNEANLAGYKLYVSTTSGNYGPSFTMVPPSRTTYEVTGLESGSTYFFRVTAYDSSGRESVPSNEVSIVVP